VELKIRPVAYPVSTKMLTEARCYAVDSIKHTVNYPGWKDEHKKFERITTGRFGQLWVAEFCKINGIECEQDETPPTENDVSDVTICGSVIDVKTSLYKSFVGQVNGSVIKKPCDYYCFLLTTREFDIVMPYGFVSYEDYKENATKLKEGDIIPGTNIKNRFNETYFLSEKNRVRPFVQFLIEKKSDSYTLDLPVILISDECAKIHEKLDTILSKINTER
jgi:hypothetical protein